MQLAFDFDMPHDDNILTSADIIMLAVNVLSDLVNNKSFNLFRMDDAALPDNC